MNGRSLCVAAIAAAALAGLAYAAVPTVPGPRVPLIGDDTTDPRVKAYFDGLRARAGVHNLHRTLANAPTLMADGRAGAIRNAATVPRLYRELIIIRSVQLNGGDYEERQHLAMAISCGLSPAQASAIRDWRSSRLFDPKVRAVLGYADGVSARSGPDDATFAALKRYFNDTEIVELTLAATTYAGNAMFTRALRVPLEPEGQAVDGC